MDLKEYTIKIASKTDKNVAYEGGDFIVREITDSDDKKYSIPKTKKDGGITKAFEQSEKVGVGETITVSVDEQEKEFTTKEGKKQKYTKRTIRMIKGDEHRTPYTHQVPQPSYGEQLGGELLSIARENNRILKAMWKVLDKAFPVKIDTKTEIKEEDLNW